MIIIISSRSNCSNSRTRSIWWTIWI